MSDWTRAHANDLARTAMQVGLMPDDARRAVEIGARLLAHGFAPSEVEAMIHWQYGQRAADERAMMGGTATLSQAARHMARTQPEERR